MAAKDPKEFVALLKSRPDTWQYGSSGVGTTQHLARELVQDELGIKLNHIPFKGVAPMLNEMLAGRIDFVAISLQTVQAHLQSGTLRAIGMLSDQRIAIAPDLPTFAEYGLTQAKMAVWMGVVGPKGMPAATVGKLHEALVATFNAPAVKEPLERQGNTIKVLTPDETQAVIRRDMLKYEALARKINLTAQ